MSKWHRIVNPDVVPNEVDMHVDEILRANNTHPAELEFADYQVGEFSANNVTDDNGNDEIRTMRKEELNLNYRINYLESIVDAVK